MRVRYVALLIVGCTLVWSVPGEAYAETIIEHNFVVSEDTTWTKEGSPYLVQDEITIDQNATLTISPGIAVQFNESGILYVLGRLLAQGTSEEPILFSSASGSWSGIEFFNQNAASSLDNVVVRNAYSISDFYSKDLSISNATIIDGYMGILAYGSHLSLNNFSAENISSDAIDISFGSDATMNTVTLKVVGAGIEVYNDSTADISNLVVSNSQNEALAVYVRSSVRVASSTITNARYAVEVFSDSLADISNLTSNGISGGEALNVSDNSTMTVNDSSIYDTDWWDAVAVFDSGYLSAKNITISNGSGDGINVFAGGSLDMQDSSVSGFTDGAGIADYGSSSNYPANFLSLIKNDIRNNYTGMSLFSDKSSYIISNNSIHQNTLYGLESYGTAIVDVSQNFWGDTSGPYNDPNNLEGRGDGIYYASESTVLFSPWLASWGTPSASNVLFLPGLKGSVLKVNDDTVWPPSFWSDDLSELALTTEGDSVNPVIVDGILETFYGTPIYSGFTAFMDELVASGTTTEWKALPYDWRFSPERILADGIQTPTGMVDPIEEIETLAAHSETGKVTIVAHSMGGLLGKAIIKKLKDEGKEDLIDSFIMVGTPQLGTPQAVASLLHGDDEGILAGFIVNSAMVRKIAQNFQSTYDLLPSPRYFDEVTEPIIAFDLNASFTQEWRDYWGPAIDTYTEFFSFITGDGVARIDPDFSDLHKPEILRTDLTEHARDFHTVYDAYTFPDSIRVVQIAGWGVPTVKAIKYRNRHFRQNYETLFTIEGDKTVVYPSAISSAADEAYFFNLEKYRREKKESVQHRDLLSSSPIQQVLTFVIKNENISQTPYIVSTKPIPGSLADQLVISTHSPVILGAYDQNSHFSGIDPNQDLGADVLLVTEDIPGSTFLTFGDSQYLFLPKEGSYTVVFKGTGSGPTDVDIEDFASDTSTLVATYSDISVIASTSATFIVNSVSPQDSHIQMDSNNDGQVDIYIAPDNQMLTLGELLTNLKTTIQNLVAKDKLKMNLLKKIKNIEKKIAKQKNKKASKAVMNLEKQIIKKGKKGRLSNADVAEIVQLLEQIENAL